MPDIEISIDACNHTEDVEISSMSALEIRSTFATRHFSTLHLLQFFADDHLPPVLRAIVLPLRMTTFMLVQEAEDGPELTVAIRKMVDAKDSFVRHYLATHDFRVN